MENNFGNSKNILSRGFIPIYYSTTSFTSKNAAYKLLPKLQECNFVSTVINIGDYDQQMFLDHKGTIIMLLSTYGNGGPPQDGEIFFQWITTLKNYQCLKNLKFIIVALGNSSFQHHCGHGKKVREVLLNLGANQLVQMQQCDSISNQRCIDKIFDIWIRKVLIILKQTYQKKQMSIIQITVGFNIKLQNKNNYNWLQHYKDYNIKKQFLNYLQSPQLDVISYKQLRQNDQQRSTLNIRLKLIPQFHIKTSCNINIYPQNIIKQKSQQQNQVIISCSTSNNMKNKIPFPPMPLIKLKKILNLKQKASNVHIKNALLLGNVSLELKIKYQSIQQYSISCEELINDLKPGLEFYTYLGINYPRSYTLASWDHSFQYIDLCVSLVQGGLTSQYFKSRPKQMRVNFCNSSFYKPINRPIVMIANGSGIAPFRSLIEFFKKSSNKPSIRLYYGIQNYHKDYYYREQWEQLQKQGIIQMKLAQSRKDPNNKIYVQNLLAEDIQYLKEHLFQNQGVIFICGGKNMAKEVNSILFKVVVAYCKVPYKGFTLLQKLKDNKTIIEEIYG